MNRQIENELKVYPSSIHYYGVAKVAVADAGECDVLVFTDESLGFTDSYEIKDGFAAPFTHANAEVLKRLFPFCAPARVLTRKFTFGVGDRLGIAGEGHLRLFAESGASPILAQQSIRELTLTGRSFDDVLDAAVFAVYKANYTDGYGADGDHLKTMEEVGYALSCGYTMITLDCSGFIRGDVAELSLAEVEKQAPKGDEVEKYYLGGSFKAGNTEIVFDREELLRIRLVYDAALDFIKKVYAEYFERDPQADFEISIDETATPTIPAAHYYIASELTRNGVKFATVAPRFCGEFQKGVDYRGDTEQFEKELCVHAAIAEHFGYKLSIHSGSDKFSVFPIIGRITNQHVHVKTAGTNWLEAMQVVAAREPALYREIHAFALTAFDEARKYYHVSTNLNAIPDISKLSDAELPALFEQDDLRQLIHITYGLILQAKNVDGFVYRDRLYSLWRREREAYAVRLYKHIGKHLRLLGDKV